MRAIQRARMRGGACSGRAAPYHEPTEDNPTGLGPMTDAAWTLLSRRLVRRDADMEYIGVVAAAAAPPWEPATYFGYCKWARVGDRHQSAVLYRGPDLPNAIAAVHERLRSKVAGTGADARYTRVTKPTTGNRCGCRTPPRFSPVGRSRSRPARTPRSRRRSHRARECPIAPQRTIPKHHPSRS